MKIVAVLQARVSSSRLPGKILRPILKRPMLALQLERIRRATQVEKLIVATSTDSSDDPLVDLCSSAGVDLFRGSLDDVLDRVYQAAGVHSPDHVVRLTGDCPLTDPAIIDAVARAHIERNADYTSNALQPTFPDGLDVEVMRFGALESAWKNARLRSEREHVTPYIYNHSELFHLHSVTASTDRSSLRWTVDEAPDLELVTRIFEALYPANPRFGSEDVLLLLNRMPELMSINPNALRNEGYEKSLRHDQAEPENLGGRHGRQ